MVPNAHSGMWVGNRAGGGRDGGRWYVCSSQAVRTRAANRTSCRKQKCASVLQCFERTRSKPKAYIGSRNEGLAIRVKHGAVGQTRWPWSTTRPRILENRTGPFPRTAKKQELTGLTCLASQQREKEMLSHSAHFTRTRTHRHARVQKLCTKNLNRSGHGMPVCLRKTGGNRLSTNLYKHAHDFQRSRSSCVHESSLSPAIRAVHLLTSKTG